MRVTNFTLAGDRVTVVARVQDGKPVFDMSILNEESVSGMSYGDLVKLCEDLGRDLESISNCWDSVGKQIAGFYSVWDRGQTP